MKIKELGPAAVVATERAAQKTIKQASAALKTGTKKLSQAEKSGALMKWKNRVSLGMQLVEVAMLATAAYQGLKLRKKAKLVPVRRRRPAKKRAAR